jgi:hypothetical protein
VLHTITSLIAACSRKSICSRQAMHDKSRALELEQERRMCIRVFMNAM